MDNCDPDGNLGQLHAHSSGSSTFWDYALPVGVGMITVIRVLPVPGFRSRQAGRGQRGRESYG